MEESDRSFVCISGSERVNRLRGNHGSASSRGESSKCIERDPYGEERWQSHRSIFSATGNTKRAAEIIARTKGLDVWEIKPKEPYTDSDLNYRNDNSRVSREHQDRSIMPEIDGDVPGWDSYETVFLGYPIWWGEAPNIVYHFVRSHDFSGKQVIPFCTSYSSDLGDSDVLLEETAKSGEWFPGTRFSGGASESDLIDWSRHF